MRCTTLSSLPKARPTRGTQQLEAHLSLPNLTPLAAAGGTDLDGSAGLDITAETKDGTTSATATGRVAITGGIAPVPALIGPDGSIDAAASLHGENIKLSHLTLNGKALNVSARGGMEDQTLDLDWTVALTDLAAIQPRVSGTLDAKGHAGGKLNDLAVQADLGADLAAKGYPSGHITAKVDATGLPATPHATINAGGTLLDAPLTLDLTAEDANGVVKVDIGQAAWKSLQAGGAISLTPPAVIPAGNLHVDVSRLADFEPLLGRKLAGKANATLDSDDKAAKLSLTVRDAAMPGTAAISKAELNASVTDPAGNPSIEGTFTADGISAGDAKSVSARVTTKGPIDAVSLSVTADAPSVADGAAKLIAAGTLNATDKTLALTHMEASWKQQALKLLAPARLNFVDGVAMDRLRLGFRQAELTVSGKPAASWI